MWIRRPACDDTIEHFSTSKLRGQFTMIHVQLDLTRMSRSDGDRALHLLGEQLLYLFRSMGFAGYNGAGHFIILLDDCSYEVAQNCVDRLNAILSKGELSAYGSCVFVGMANSVKDEVYEVRALLRLAMQRCAAVKKKEDEKDRNATPVITKE